MKNNTFDENVFITNLIPESIYLLGFLWGDGYLYKKRNSIRMKIISEDMKQIQNVVDATGNWNFYHYLPKNRKAQTEIQITNKRLFNFLEQKLYLTKSTSSHEFIINHIPQNLQYLWFRGYFDADGCIYSDKTSSCIQSSISSTYGQNWEYISKYLLAKNIQNSFHVRCNSKSKSSLLRIIGKNNNYRLFNFLYPKMQYDGIGLLRKFNKFNSIDYINHSKTVDVLPIIKAGAV